MNFEHFVGNFDQLAKRLLQLKKVITVVPIVFTHHSPTGMTVSEWLIIKEEPLI